MEKLGLVWRNRKKISQIIKDYLYLPFFLLFILCLALTVSVDEKLIGIDHSEGRDYGLIRSVMHDKLEFRPFFKNSILKGHHPIKSIQPLYAA